MKADTPTLVNVTLRDGSTQRIAIVLRKHEGEGVDIPIADVYALTPNGWWERQLGTVEQWGDERLWCSTRKDHSAWGATDDWVSAAECLATATLPHPLSDRDEPSVYLEVSE